MLQYEHYSQAALRHTGTDWMEHRSFKVQTAGNLHAVYFAVASEGECLGCL